jgi:exodeoxyribonuclease VII small subunit
MAQSAKKADTAPATGFDARLCRLEAIVSELEGGGLALEASIDRYQEGVALLGECRTILAGFQQRVEELSADAEGHLRPYAGDPDAENSTGTGRS